jgi:GGDEF domain-containing protein
MPSERLRTTQRSRSTMRMRARICATSRTRIRSPVSPAGASSTSSSRGCELSLLLIDFDGLKGVNDALGYDRGDALIAAVGVALAANVNEGELAARLGGDEFVVVLPEADGRVRAGGPRS